MDKTGLTRFRWNVLAAVVVACIAGPVHATPVDPVVAQAIALVRKEGLNASLVDWPAVESEAAALARGTEGEAGRTKAIWHVLKALRDHHSHYIPPIASAPPTPPLDLAAAPLPIAVAQPPAGRFGHLVINRWRNGSEGPAEATSAVRAALNAAMQHDACGLIIDVSTNGGGNMWPMMGGIAPLYDEGALQSFEHRDGSRSLVHVAGGRLRLDDAILPDVPLLAPVAREPRYIALILGTRTASSGEILALGFRYQANVRSFGTATTGATTANASRRLSNGGVVALTTSRLLDRRGKVQHGALIPDETTGEPLAAATRWLSQRCDATAAAD